MGTVTLRFAEKADAGMMMAIYAPFVLETTATWETAVPPRPEFEARMERCSADGLPWLVAEEGGALLGYACAARFGRRAGYAWDVEVSVYLSEDAHGRHIGTALYGALLALVSRQGYINCYALITEGNLASEEFHKALGFEPAARLECCGYKMGQWLNLCYYHLALSARPQAPAKPVPLSAVPAEQAASVLRRASMLVKGAGGH